MLNHPLLDDTAAPAAPRACISACVFHLLDFARVAVLAVIYVPFLFAVRLASPTPCSPPPLTRARAQILLQSAFERRAVDPARWRDTLRPQAWAAGTILFAVRARLHRPGAATLPPSRDSPAPRGDPGASSSSSCPS